MPKRKNIISSDSEGSDDDNLEEVSFLLALLTINVIPGSFYKYCVQIMARRGR